MVGIFFNVSQELDYIVNWKQNVNNVQADSSNGSQPRISESKELQKAEKIIKQLRAI